MKKGKGSNLVEYAIPLALIGLVVGVGLYNLFSNNTILNYIMASFHMQKSGNTLIIK